MNSKSSNPNKKLYTSFRMDIQKNYLLIHSSNPLIRTKSIVYVKLIGPAVDEGGCGSLASKGYKYWKRN
jgi:hypothetical protein